MKGIALQLEWFVTQNIPIHAVPQCRHNCVRFVSLFLFCFGNNYNGKPKLSKSVHVSRYTGVEKVPKATLGSDSFCPACDHEHRFLSWHQLLWTPQVKMCWVNTRWQWTGPLWEATYEPAVQVGGDLFGTSYLQMFSKVPAEHYLHLAGTPS